MQRHSYIDASGGSHEFAEETAASLRKFGVGKRFHQRFPKIKQSVSNPFFNILLLQNRLPQNM